MFAGGRKGRSRKRIFIFSYWSTRPTTTIYFNTDRPYVSKYVRPSVGPYVRTSVRPKTSKSNDNHCRSGLWACRVDPWWLLSCSSFISFYFEFDLKYLELPPLSFPSTDIESKKASPQEILNTIEFHFTHSIDLPGLGPTRWSLFFMRGARKTNPR